MKNKYIKFGEGSKNMLIIPGLSLKPVSINPQAVIDAYETFHKEFTIYLFDYPTDMDKNYSISDIADDFLDTITELQLSDIYLYGVSMGGMVSQELLSKKQELFKKVVLISTTSKVVNQDIFDNWTSLAKQGKTDELVVAFMDKVYTEEFNKQYGDVVKMMYKNTSQEELDYFVSLANSARSFDIADRLNNVKIETLVLGSKKDKIFTQEEMNLLKDKLDAYIYLYDDYSHAIYDEAPDLKKRVYDFYMGL